MPFARVTSLRVANQPHVFTLNDDRLAASAHLLAAERQQRDLLAGAMMASHGGGR